MSDLTVQQMQFISIEIDPHAQLKYIIIFQWFLIN